MEISYCFIFMKHTNVLIPKGKVTAIAGPSGSGKNSKH